MSLGRQLMTPVLSLAALCCSAAAWTQARSATAHEQQLQAIRQALLEATLETPTKVLSSAWIDSKGTLHESHEFHSQAEVRGVRVLSYLNDGEEPQARVSAEVLPWNWRQRPDAQADCTPSPRNWRLPMTTMGVLGRGFSGPQQAAAQEVLSTALNGWRSLLQQASRWTPVAWQAPVANTYLKALQATPDQETGGWNAIISLRPIPGVQQAWYDTLKPWDTSPVWRWTLDVLIGQRTLGGGDLKVISQQTMELEVDTEALARQPSIWLQALQTQLMQGLTQGLETLQSQTRCEPVQFTVRRHDQQPMLRLQAGVDSGLRPGDRVLLLKSGWVPGRILDPRSLEHLALAEVVQTGPRHTEIRQLAGPALARQGEWIALPL